MKKQAYMILAALVLTTVAGLSAAKAQVNANTGMVANIPFEFSVGSKILPAGEYTVRSINSNSATKVLQIRSTTGSASALVMTDSVIGKIKDNAQLIFHRYGNEYFFAQAWMPADSVGMQAPRSKAEKVFELARGKRATEAVVASTRR